MAAGEQTQSSGQVAKAQVKTCGYKNLQDVGYPRFSIGAHPMKSLVALRPAETCRTLIEKAAEAALVLRGFSEELE